MHAAKSVLVASGVALVLGGTPGFAQVAPIVDIAAVQAECTSTAACKAAIAAAIAAIEAAGLPEAQANTELGNLAAAVIEVAKETNTPVAVAGVVDMLDDIKEASTNSAQQASIETAKSSVSTGNIDQIDTGTAFGASEAG